MVKIIKRAMSSVGLKQNVGIICGGTNACSYNEKGIDTEAIEGWVRNKALHTIEEHITVGGMEKQ